MEEAGFDVPDDVGAVFDLWDVNKPYYRAFDVLSPARDWIGGMGPLTPKPISYRDKVMYARVNGFRRPRERFERFLALVDVQDDEFLKSIAKRRKR